MQKKILFFIGGSYVAGLEIVTLLLIKGLKDKGCEVKCVVNGWNDGDFKNRLSAMDISYYEVKLGWLYFKKPGWTVDTLIHYPSAYRTCSKAMKDFKPDIIHFTNYTVPVMLYPLIINNSFYTLHDTQLPNLKHRLIYKLLNRKICNFIAVSNHIAATLSNLSIPGSKITTIYNGIMPPADVNVKKNTSGSLSFAIIGQVIPSKGHEVLINAVALLADRGFMDFTVTIIGNDNNEYSQALRQLITEKKLDSFFTWRGFIKNTDDIYAGADVVIVPSLCIESFSLTTAEAMIRGLVVIASNRGGMMELIDHDENGLLFIQGDAAALSNCMQQLVTNRDQLKMLGDKAREKAMKNFTTEVMVEHYIKTYDTNISRVRE